MKILMAASEMVPFAKTGGLGDVVGALPKALLALGEEVRAVLPHYPLFTKDRFRLEPLEGALRLPFQGRNEAVSLSRWTSPEGLTCYLIGQERYFGREALYGTPQGDYPDNAERFSCFARAVLELCRVEDFYPDILHVHDWQAALCPAYLRTLYGKDPSFARVRCLLTIHNLAYQGIFPGEKFSLTELPKETFSMEGLEFYGKVNFLKGGIVFSDAITTVSRTYSREIQTEEYGCGLEGLLRKHQVRLFGILNGVDYEEWDPAIDPHIPSPYQAKDIRGKRLCRRALLSSLGLEDRRGRAVVGMITRLAAQKGLDLLASSIDRLMALDICLVVLGTGEERYHQLLSGIAARFPKRAAVHLTFDNALAHQIEAGADIFLMPSRYEPCGLNQIYSLRYGTVPVVRATGGLEDTVEEFDPWTREGNGFKFSDYSEEALLEAVRRALSVYRNKTLWRRLIRNGMSADFSWNRSAEEYRALYREIARRSPSAA